MHKRTRLGLLLVETLLVFPLLAVPLYLVGHFLADAADNDDSNGVFALDLILGVAGPGLLAILITLRTFRFPAAAALVLGILTSLLSVAVLFIAFLIYCRNCDL